MSASLVGSEMCIRDRNLEQQRGDPEKRLDDRPGGDEGRSLVARVLVRGCLLYTSDAADDM
eukprot:6271299-Alexandrium_andersonii.AAC.1